MPLPAPGPVGPRGDGAAAGPGGGAWPGLASWSEVGARVPVPRTAARGRPADDATGRELDDGEETSGEAERSLVPRPAGGGRVRRTLARWLPAALADSLVDPGRPGATALVLVVLAAAVLAGVGVWSSRPQAQPIGGLPAVSIGPGAPGPAATPAPAPGAPAGPLVVSVVGKVARPGLVRVPDGARVADAVDAAGGALPGVDLSVLNLARRLGDGEQVAIGVRPAPDAQPTGAPAGDGAASGGTASGGAAAGGTASDGAATGAKVNLNQATAEQLDALPGVGPVTARKILDWRTRNGRFSRVEQLREVDGIGERKFARLREAVTV